VRSIKSPLRRSHDAYHAPYSTHKTWAYQVRGNGIMGSGSSIRYTGMVQARAAITAYVAVSCRQRMASLIMAYGAGAYSGRRGHGILSIGGAAWQHMQQHINARGRASLSLLLSCACAAPRYTFESSRHRVHVTALLRKISRLARALRSRRVSSYCRAPRHLTHTRHLAGSFCKALFDAAPRGM